MVTLTIHSTSSAAIDRLKAQAPIAQARALNRAIASAKTAMVRVIGEDLSLKAGDVRDKIRVEEARPDQLRARLYASYKRIPVIDFGAKGLEPSRGKGHGVTAKLGASRTRYPTAFIATMKSGHRGVFRRVTGANQRGALPNRPQLPIRELFGPSIAHVFVKHVDVGLARGEEQLLKNLSSEFRFAIRPTA